MITRWPLFSYFTLACAISWLYANLGPVDLIGWTVGLVLGAVFLTWLYNSTSRSLLAIVLWHGLFNTFIASEAAGGLIAAVMTTAVMAFALFAIVVAGSRELRGLSRAAGPRQQHEPARSHAPEKREAA